MTRKSALRLAAPLAVLGWLCIVDIAAAQFSGYPAYGAWRGRASTVVGPNVARSRVRWGGGITPQGAAMIQGIATNPDFLNFVGGFVPGRSLEMVEYVSEEELHAVRALRAENRAALRQAEAQERSALRSESDSDLKYILAVHAQTIRELQARTPGMASTGAAGVPGGLEARTQHYLTEAKAIYDAKGDSSRIPDVQKEGEYLEQRYGEAQKALRATNAALKALQEARGS